MPIKPRSTPGPRAESCLTCRQRKKKCDKVRPFCLRCLNSKGTYTCLGYDNETHEPGAEKVVLEERTTIEPTIILPWLTLGVEFRDTVPGPSTGDAYFDSLMLPSPPKSSTLAIDLLLNRPDQGVGREPNLKKYRPRNIVTLPAPDFVPRGVRAEKQMRESYFMFIMKECRLFFFL
ncbi:hypothetical protein RSOLAG1IB_06773 [Rhizoctonia solani AG-1 IB]|uniref:Zn(2)-C6 fungal-type domain-containing protein n=1 Tax=Thanatephorus cucumeris (strain AG1-IB / isolate 7/3/14) TaxID=1108050 RepID=A0A0B7FB13_THACB|nr:hypothetical protein RSOLAG1IB_06773 [Rhizoctonia solani AG-1 IB]